MLAGAGESPADLRQEALSLLAASALPDVLSARFGACAVVGSVDMDLMTWRDIDLYVPVDRGNPQLFVASVPVIYEAFDRCAHTVIRMTFNDEWTVPRGSYGSGYYLGMRILSPSGAKWKLDLWGWEPFYFAEKLREHRELKRSLADLDRNLILRLKREASARGVLRREITSWDIYQFTLSGRGRTFDDLLSFCCATRDGEL